MISWQIIQKEINKHLPNIKIPDVKIRNLDTKYEQSTDLKKYFETYYPETEMNILTSQIEKEKAELAESKN